MSDAVYTPHQHMAQPQGCSHMTIFASVELWHDDPPDVIEIGEYRYGRIEKEDISSDGAADGRLDS